jgi:hydroxymethylbilane synthase
MCGMPDGSRILRAEIGGPTADAVLLGEKLADDLLAQGARDILAATQL